MLIATPTSAQRLRAVGLYLQRFCERVWAALRAAPRRLTLPRRCAAERACLESERCDAALRLSRFKALRLAWERLREGFRARLRDVDGLLRVFADA
jgi:hypothetical protein